MGAAHVEDRQTLVTGLQLKQSNVRVFASMLNSIQISVSSYVTIIHNDCLCVILLFLNAYSSSNDVKFKLLK